MSRVALQFLDGCPIRQRKGNSHKTTRLEKANPSADVTCKMEQIYAEKVGSERGLHPQKASQRFIADRMVMSTRGRT